MRDAGLVAAKPSDEVLGAFGVDAPVQALPGGQGSAWHAGGVVLKPVDDPAEAAWTSELLSRVEPDGFRLGEPVVTGDGRWVHDGWAAWRFVPDLRPLGPRWHDVIDAGLRFCDAAERVRTDDGGVLARRTHRWAVADRVAWGEEPIELAGDDAALFAQLATGFEHAERVRQFVHGDLAGNVFVDRGGTPVILDVSPYIRPRRWAEAVVVCDAILWHDGGLALAEALVADGDRDLLHRALAFRFLADRAVRAAAPQHDRYRALVRSLR